MIKRLALLFLLSFFLTTPIVFARDYTYTRKDSGDILTITTTSTEAKITYNPVGTSRAYVIQGSIPIYEICTSVPTLVSGCPEKNKVSKTRSVSSQSPTTFTISGLKPLTTYYIPFYDGNDPFPFQTDYPYLLSQDNFNVTSTTTTQATIHIAAQDLNKKFTLFLSKQSLFGTATLKDGSGIDKQFALSVNSSQSSATATIELPSSTYYYVSLATSNADGTYTLVGSTATMVLFGNETEIFSKPLSIQTEGGTAIISGQIDTTKHPNPENYDVKFEYSPNNVFTTDLKVTPEGTKVGMAQTSTDTPSIQGVNHDGTYYWKFDNIGPTAYWFRETFYTKKGAPVGTPFTDKFNGATGYAPKGSAAADKDFESRSYRLLAPLPGLSVLLDPSLCREQKIEHPGQKQLCDINDFLNYVFKLLIGASAVVLVIRIIIEGFRYATSDVLAIKINSKEKLWQGVWGLLLALSAWLILNTINPKLVQNDISLPGVELSIENDGDIAAPITLGDTGQLPAGVYCPKSGKAAAVSKVSQSWVGKVVYYLDGSKKDGFTVLGKGKNPGALTDGKARLDCSGYVNVVLACSGYTAGTDFINSGTADIFKNAEQIKSIASDTTVTTDKGVVTLQPGDLLGWTSKSNGSTWGHVIIYIGNGEVMESTRVSGNVRSPVKLTNYSRKEKLSFLKEI